jgi:F-type H+-transporting ATPase subunit gamma
MPATFRSADCLRNGDCGFERMASTRELRRRIKSISSTLQITRAMQMVAASKMRRAQQAALAGRPFIRLLYRIQRETISWAGEDFSHPLLETREVRKRCVVLVSADKGLCGPLNTNLFRLATPFDPKTTVFIAAGRRAAQFLARTGRQMVAEFSYDDTPRFPDAKAIASLAADLFLKKEVDQVLVIATRFVNTLMQQPLCLELLPIGEIKAAKDLWMDMDLESHLAADTGDTVFEPSADAVLGLLLPRSLDIYMYQVLLNARASEQSARMVAMKNATESAENLIKDLTLEYNKLRQGNITKELLEIAGGQAS